VVQQRAKRAKRGKTQAQLIKWKNQKLPRCPARGGGRSRTSVWLKGTLDEVFKTLGRRGLGETKRRKRPKIP